MAATQLDRENPWPGLESCEESARDYFHGRETEAEDLLRRVADAPLTVLFGKSGLGKTSLLRAGLFPRLREKHFLPVHVRLDIRPEAPGLIDQLRDALLAEIARERVDAPPFGAGETLWEYLHRADLELWSEQNYPLTPVLVLDQFEEVFTLGERLPESVERFKTDLGDLAENRIPAALANRPVEGLDLRRMAYKLVVTLREDFLPHLEGWRAAVPSLGRVRVRLLPMRPEQALSAVYDTAPHLMDEPLARRIVEFVAAAAEGESGEIEPALLSLFCRGLNERRKKQGAARFDAQLLEGAQQSIIADYYRSCVEELPDSVSRFIESDLITEKGFRNSYAKDDAVPAFLTEGQLDRLINRRLLRVEERYGTARIELTHDLLTRAVMADRDRRRLEEEKTELARQARTQRRRVMAMAFVALICLAFAGIAAWQWYSAVYATKVAEKAKAAADRAKNVALRAKGEADVARSVAERAKMMAERSTHHAQRAESEARAAEAEAQTQAALAKESAARELVARGSSEARRLETESRLAFDNSANALAKATLLAVASVRHVRTVDGQISLTQFLELLPRAPLWRRSVVQPTEGQGFRRTALAVSPDGAWLAVVDSGGPVQLLDARTGQPVRSFEVARNDPGMTALAFSPDGKVLVLGCGHQACVLDAASGQLLARLPSAEARHGDGVWAASFSPDGKRLAVASYGSEEVFVYDVATWQATTTIRPGGITTAVAFNSGGEFLAIGDTAGLQLWRVGREEPVGQVRTNDNIVSIVIHGSALLASPMLQAWWIRPVNASEVRLEAAVSKPIEAHTVLPVSMADRDCFAAAEEHAVHLLCDQSLREILRFPLSSVAAAVSPNGRSLFNEQSDGIVAAWPLDAGPDVARIPLGGPVRSMTIAGQDGWLAAGMDSGEIAIVDVDSRKESRRLRLAAAPVDKVVASSDGRWLAVVQGPSLHVFDTGTWREVASATYEADITTAAFDRGDHWLVVVTGTNVVVWQPSGWRERRRFAHDGRIDAVRVSPDGRQLATTTRWPAGHDSGVHLAQVFDLANGNEIGWEYTSGGGNISVKAMQDEAARRQRALAGGSTASVREAVSSWPVLKFEEASERVSADGAWHVGVSESEATLRDVVANRQITRFDHRSNITDVRFVPALAPRWLVTAGEDGTLAVWPIRTDDLVREACTRLRAIFGQETLNKLIADAHAEGSCE